MPRFVLDRDIKAMQYDAVFMQKATDHFLNGYGYSRRFMYQHNVYKFCQRGNGEWLLYRESNGPIQQTLQPMEVAAQMCRPMPWVRKPLRDLLLDDMEAHYYRRINELPNPKDRLRLKSLLAQVKLDLERIPNLKEAHTT